MDFQMTVRPYQMYFPCLTGEVRNQFIIIYLFLDHPGKPNDDASTILYVVLFFNALKPESFRPSDAWNDRFFRCLRRSEARPSLEKTA